MKDAGTSPEMNFFCLMTSADGVPGFAEDAEWSSKSEHVIFDCPSYRCCDSAEKSLCRSLPRQLFDHYSSLLGGKSVFFVLFLGD